MRRRHFRGRRTPRATCHVDALVRASVGRQEDERLLTEGRSAMSNIKGLNDMKEENDDEKRQAYYAGGQGQHGSGGRRAAHTTAGRTAPS